MIVIPIVEGHGDVDATPILLRRLAESFGVPYIDVRKPIRCSRDKVVKEGELERALTLALAKLNGEFGGIFILLDSDDDCPAELGPSLLARAIARAPEVPIGLVLANKEYEAWFLASLGSLRGRRGVSLDAQPPEDPERIRGAKGYLERTLEENLSYSETVDQPAFTAVFDLEEARQRSPSFDKCAREVERLVWALSNGGEAQKD